MSDLDSAADSSDIEPRPGSRHADAAAGHGEDDLDGSSDGQVADADEEDDGGGLFGSDDEGEAKARQLDDEELDSGDDEHRNDRAADASEREADEEAEEDANVMDLEFGIHAAPQGSDGETYLLRFPAFIGIDPTAMNPKNFELPTTDHHHGEAPPSSTFSQRAVALSSLRWRRSTRDRNVMESNARIIRWSDGNLSLQHGGRPTEQYELSAKSLAAPQLHPTKPTPSSRLYGRGGNAKAPQEESYTYLASTHEIASLLRNTHHVTTSLSMLPGSVVADDALARLQSSLAAATRNSNTKPDGTLNIISITEDPELAKKKAEAAEKEQLRIARKMQQTQMRDAERASRTLSRHGLGRSGGLNVDDLEGDDRPLPTRIGRKQVGMPRAKRNTHRRGDSDTDDDMPRGRTREDEYDKTDDFLVDSEEEEEEEAEGDGDEEEEEVVGGEESEEEPKRERKGSIDGVGDEAATTGPRAKKRRVLVDDEDEE